MKWLYDIMYYMNNIILVKDVKFRIVRWIKFMFFFGYEFCLYTSLNIIGFR